MVSTSIWRRSTRLSGGCEAALPGETTLIGFCGAPWTVATYMIAGRGSPDQVPGRLFAYREPEAMAKLLDVLAEHSAAFLMRQIEAGADAVQIFDSWAGVLDEASFEAFCVEPIAGIVAAGSAGVSGCAGHRLSEGCGSRYDGFRRATGATALGLDWTVPLRLARALQAEGAVQGNLDPQRLVAGGKPLPKGWKRS